MIYVRIHKLERRKITKYYNVIGEHFDVSFLFYYNGIYEKGLYGFFIYLYSLIFFHISTFYAMVPCDRSVDFIWIIISEIPPLKIFQANLAKRS